MKTQLIPARGVGFVRLAWRTSMVLAALSAVSPVLAGGFGAHLDGGWAFAFGGCCLLCAAALRSGSQPGTAKIGLIALALGLSVAWLHHSFGSASAHLPLAPNPEARFIGNQQPKAKHFYFSGSAPSTNTQEPAK